MFVNFRIVSFTNGADHFDTRSFFERCGKTLAAVAAPAFGKTALGEGVALDSTEHILMEKGF